MGLGLLQVRGIGLGNQSQISFALLAEALELMESLIVGAFEAGLLAADHGYGAAVVEGYLTQAAGVVEMPTVRVLGYAFQTQLVVAGFHVE